MTTRPPLSTAATIAVGSELLIPPRLDTNSLTITSVLAEIGIAVISKCIVGDRIDHVAEAIRHALAQVDLVIVTGGLGPTDDDVTRDAVAQVLGRKQQESGEIVDRLRRRFASRGLEMPAINRRQAMVIEGADVLDNPNGTAPGQWIEEGERVVLLLPGPPRELEPMLATVVERRLRERAAPGRIHKRSILIVGLGESHAEERLQPCYARWHAQPIRIDATILASGGQIELHLFARAEEAAAQAALAAAVAEVQERFGPHVVSVDGRTIEETVGALLQARGWRVAVAESCTGGLVTSRLTDVPGSSGWVERSVVVYSNAAKIELLGVPASLIEEHGAVSEPVAQAMAEGVRRIAHVEAGVGVTGIAGPTGGSEAKPVGTVCIAVAAGERTVVKTFRYPGTTRRFVKTLASLGALDMLRRSLIPGGHERGTWEAPPPGR
ncbi:MAG TPA: competence/damage-inducible protein A [Vicinamibacterales bacterium]